MTNLGPLTTTFSPIGPDCSSTFEGSLGNNRWLQYGVPGNPSSACLPSNFNNNVGYFYSPGLCPSGYTSACTGWVSATTGFTWETETTCCPSGYLCRNDRGNDPYECLSGFEGPRTFAVSLYNIATDSTGVTTKIDSGRSVTTVLTGEAVFAYAIVVRTAASNILSGAVTSPVGNLTTAINSATGNGLSAGVAAGIGIGVGLGTILLIGNMVFLIRLYRRRLRGSQVQDHYESEQGPVPSSHPRQQPQEHQKHLEPQEHQGTPHEMSTEREPGELSAGIV
ncbi:hypothetical protein F4824DRAFT_518232 [Ustulina deusta]|nr:hypothetical protein F4824DRAFT_518232 [Ustulina deusta]